jgi:hypothetical protein
LKRKKQKSGNWGSLFFWGKKKMYDDPDSWHQGSAGFVPQQKTPQVSAHQRLTTSGSNLHGIPESSSSASSSSSSSSSSHSSSSSSTSETMPELVSMSPISTVPTAQRIVVVRTALDHATSFLHHPIFTFLMVVLVLMLIVYVVYACFLNITNFGKRPFPFSWADLRQGAKEPNARHAAARLEAIVRRK